jgi:hypothetical protein
LPVRLLIRDHGDRMFAHVLTKLRCQKCHKPPAPVYLCAGHREHTMGSARLGYRTGAVALRYVGREPEVLKAAGGACCMNSRANSGQCTPRRS